MAPPTSIPMHQYRHECAAGVEPCGAAGRWSRMVFAVLASVISALLFTGVVVGLAGVSEMAAVCVASLVA